MKTNKQIEIWGALWASIANQSNANALVTTKIMTVMVTMLMTTSADQALTLVTGI